MAMKNIDHCIAGDAGARREQPIVIAGCGPGAPDLITPAARAAAETADVLVGAKRLLDLFPAVSAEKIQISADIQAGLDRMAAISSSRKLVVLVSGDPGFHSLGRAVLARFGRSVCRVIPGISSVQVAFARIGMTWEEAHLISAHETPPTCEPAALTECEKIAVLAGNRAAANWLKSAVLALQNSHAVFICSDLTLPNEQVKEVAQEHFDPAALPARTVILFINRRLLA